jgi:hypothetical protein
LPEVVVRPTIVGGQAVNLWAIAFLEDGDPPLSTKYASDDLDVLSGPRVLEFLKGLEPGWRAEETGPIAVRHHRPHHPPGITAGSS